MPRNKKIATTETQDGDETQKFSASEKLSDSVVVRKQVKKKVDSHKANVLKREDLTVDVFDTKGKVTEQITLPKEIFGVKVNNAIMAQAVRVYLANKRAGTVSTKTRGEVRGSTRKIYKQKGTGRARHGAIRAPIFVGGGIVFGPKPRDFSLSFPKKMKRIALFSVLSAKLKEGGIRVVAGAEKIKPKTKEAVAMLRNMSILPKNRKILMVLPSFVSSGKTSDGKPLNIIKAARNIEGVTFIPANMLNTYEVLNANMLLFLKEAIPMLSDTFVKKKEV